MATTVLNVATELSLEYKTRNIEISLVDIIQTKWDLSMKYARELNNTGSGFIDDISCPQNFSMSGTLSKTTGISTTIHYLSWSIVCIGTHNGFDVEFYFNTLSTDLEFSEYRWKQLAVNSWSTTGTFTDSDNTYLDLSGSYPLLPDNLDDNFDSDNYTIYSTGSVLYPDGYIDNDVKSRLVNYGYIIENTGLYNIFWSNTKMKDYIDQNTYNTGSVYTNISQISSWNLYLDIDSWFRLVLYSISSSDYDETKELIVNSTVVGTWQLAWIWYLQDDLSLSASKTGAEYDFDFTANDYALFLENTGTNSLLYQVFWEDAVSGSGVYLNPLKDDDVSIFSYLWSHMLVNDEGKLIGNQFEIFGLK